MELIKFVKSPTRRENILNHKYGVGGLHWCKGSGLFSDVIDIDAKSFYPHILSNWNLLPNWINEKRYKDLLERRMAGDKSESLKLALNIPTGKLRMPNAPVIDQERGLTMCIIGQILITVLYEYLYDIGYKAIQINTDGIMVEKTEQSQPDKFMEVIYRWTSLFNIPLSIKDIAHIEQLDVNNYKAIYKDGTVKIKGAKFKNKK